MTSRARAASIALAGVFAGLLTAALVAGEARGEERAPVIAVFEIQDTTRRPKRLPAGLTDYLRVKLAETRLVKVVDKGDQETQLKRLIKAERKSSYKTCVDESCQIPLGKELAADKILRGKITRFGKAFVLALEMVDLATGASAGAASDKNDGTEEGLMASVEKVAVALTADLKAKADEAALEATRAKEAEQAKLVKAEPVAQLNVNPVPQPQPTQAKVVVDDGPSGGELTMIIGGWSIFGVAYIGEIIINLIAADIAGAYYSLLPIGGPIFIELVNQGVPGYESKPINYIAAGVQALGAGVAVVGHILASMPDEKPGQAGLTGPGEVRVSFVLGPNHVGIAGTF